MPPARIWRFLGVIASAIALALTIALPAHLEHGIACRFWMRSPLLVAQFTKLLCHSLVLIVR